MRSHLLTQTPCGRWQTDEIVKKCSATELVRAVGEGNRHPVAAFPSPAFLERSSSQT